MTSGSGRRRQRSNYATPGRLAPGEKQRLKRAKVDAKRAARASSKGFDAAAVAAQLEQFVLARGDMKVLLPAPYPQEGLCRVSP